jgi:hypothetical protein
MYPLGIAGRWMGLGAAAGGGAESATTFGGDEGRFRRPFVDPPVAAPLRPETPLRAGEAATRAVEPERAMGRVIDLGEPEASRVR